MATVMERYKKFSDDMDDPNAEPIKVFKPLNQKLVNDLLLIREVSKTLQQKKDDEIARVAQAAKEAEEKQKKEKENKKPEPEVKEEGAKEEGVKEGVKEEIKKDDSRIV